MMTAPATSKRNTTPTQTIYCNNKH